MNNLCSLPNFCRPRHGAVLVVVLVLVVMVALAGFGFLAEMTTEYEAARINGDLLQAQQMMASAETYLLAVTEEHVRNPAGLQSLDHNPDLFQARSLSGEQSLADIPDRPVETVETVETPSVTDDVWRFCVVPDLKDSVASSAMSGDVGMEADSITSLEADAPSLRFGLQNESSRLNLNTVLQWDAAEPGRGRRALLQLSGMTDEAADGILDWIDADDEAREFGAEAEYYQRLNHPCRPRNGLPDTLEELLFVKGVTRDMFFGSSDQAHFFGDATHSGWPQQLTLHSAERNVDSAGLPRIYLNSGSAADLPELEERLRGIVSEELARYIVLAKMYGISYSTELGIAPLQVDFNTFSTSTVLPITNLSDLLDSSVQLPAAVGGQRVNSPLTTTELSTLQTFAILEDRITTESMTVLPGRVNINQASEDVLRALTDDPAAASQIVQQRQTVDATERRSTLWLLTRQVIDLPLYRRIFSDVTTRGHVYSGEIIVYRRIGGPFLRRKVTIDAANPSVGRVNWLDKTAQGLPVSLNALELK
ncbi:MAG: type II secretion system protein GspK [Fuerstiella sp.]